MRASWIVFLVTTSSLPGCSRPSASAPATEWSPSAADMAACAKAESSDRRVFARYVCENAFDGCLRDWYAAQLCAMGEGPLTAPSKGGERIRFLWLRSFHPGIAVRVDHGVRGTTLIAIELNGAGGYAPGTVARRVERSVSPEEWTTLQQALAESALWNLRTSERNEGRDGAQWIVEIAEHDRYHVVDRWNGGAIEPLGRLLLELSQLAPEPIY